MLFIAAIEFFSKSIEFKQIDNKTAETVALFFKEIFSRYRLALEIISDNNPFIS